MNNKLIIHTLNELDQNKCLIKLEKMGCEWNNGDLPTDYILGYLYNYLVMNNYKIYPTHCLKDVNQYDLFDSCYMTSTTFLKNII